MPTSDFRTGDRSVRIPLSWGKLLGGAISGVLTAALSPSPTGDATHDDASWASALRPISDEPTELPSPAGAAGGGWAAPSLPAELDVPTIEIPDIPAVPSRRSDAYGVFTSSGVSTVLMPPDRYSAGLITLPVRADEVDGVQPDEFAPVMASAPPRDLAAGRDRDRDFVPWQVQPDTLHLPAEAKPQNDTKPQATVPNVSINFVQTNKGVKVEFRKGRERPSRKRKRDTKSRDKSGRMYKRALRFINKTYGEFSEVLDAFEVLVWNINKVNPDGTQTPAMLIERGNYQDTLQGLIDGEYELDVGSFLIDFSVMQAQDLIIGKMSQTAQQGLNAAGYTGLTGSQYGMQRVTRGLN